MKTLEELRTLLKYGAITEEQFRAEGGYHESVSKKGKVETKEYLIEKYIGEDKEVMEELRRIYKEEDKIVLLESNTGSGKTVAICGASIQTKEKILVIVPNIMTADVMSQQLNAKYPELSVACHGSNRLSNVIGHVSKDKQIIFSTVDQLKNIVNVNQNALEDRILIIDEAHYYFKVTGFRYEAIIALEEVIKKKLFKKMIFVTATPDVFKLYGKAQKIIKIKPKTYPIKYNLVKVRIKVGMENRKDASREYVNSLGGRTVVYLNKSKQDQLIHTMIAGDGHYRINADTKSDKVFQHIKEHHRIPEYVRVLYVTDLFTAGASLKNKDIKHIVFLGETNKDTIKQFSARFRDSENISIHVIDEFTNSGRSENDFLRDLNERIGDEQEDLQNNDYNTDTSHRYGLINGMFYEINGDIKVSEFARTNSIYENRVNGQKQFCFSEFVKEEIMEKRVIDLEGAELIKHGETKEVLELQLEHEMDALEVKIIETLDNRLEQLVRSNHSFSKVAEEEGYKKHEKSILQKMVNIIKDTELDDSKYYRSLYELTKDKDLEREYRYRLIADSVKDTGVVTDNMLFYISKQKSGFTFDKNNLDEKNHHLWRKCVEMANALFYMAEGKIDKRKVYTIVSRKDSVRDVFGRKVQDEMRKYYLGKLRKKEIV